MKKLLIVEDCQELQRLLSYTFKNDYFIYNASNGKEAWKCILSNKIDCILLDLEMPVMNGLEFMEQLKKKGGNIPIIVTTGRSNHDYAVRCADLGVKGYLQKPYAMEEIKERLNYILGTQAFMDASLDTAVHPKVKEAVHFVLQNYQQQIKLTNLSKNLGISPDHLSATFKKDMGIPLIKFINSVRIRAAKDLLKSSDLSMSDIMGKAGFNTEPHFYTCFKKMEGITPNKFRASFGVRKKK